MRPLLLPAAALGAAALASCGGDDASPAPPPVRLAVTAPRDQAVVPARRIELRGTVRPSGASVTVGGKRAAVSGGTFRASVALAPGTNVIDVLARAGAARPALTAIRVRRDVSVRIPDVTGLPVESARRRLIALGLNVDVQEDGGILDRLLPGDPRVCDTEPRADGRVDSGSTVRLLVARRC